MTVASRNPRWWAWSNVGWIAGVALLLAAPRCGQDLDVEVPVSVTVTQVRR